MTLVTPAVTGTIALLALFSAASVASLNNIAQRISPDLVPIAFRRFVLPWLLAIAAILAGILISAIAPIPQAIANQLGPLLWLSLSVGIALLGSYRLWTVAVDSDQLAQLLRSLSPSQREAAYRTALRRAVANDDNANVRILIASLVSVDAGNLPSSPFWEKGARILRALREKVEVRQPRLILFVARVRLNGARVARAIWEKLPDRKLLLKTLYVRLRLKVVGIVRARWKKVPDPAPLQVPLGLRFGDELPEQDETTSLLVWLATTAPLEAHAWLVEELVNSLVGDWRRQQDRTRAYENLLRLLDTIAVQAATGRTEDMKAYRQFAEQQLGFIDASQPLPIFDRMRANLSISLLPQLLNASTALKMRYAWDPIAYGFGGAISMAPRFRSQYEGRILTSLFRTFAKIYDLSVIDSLPDSSVALGNLGLGHTYLWKFFRGAVPLCWYRLSHRREPANYPGLNLPETDEFLQSIAYTFRIPKARDFAYRWCCTEMFRHEFQLSDFAFMSFAKEIVRHWESMLQATEVPNSGEVRVWFTAAALRSGFGGYVEPLRELGPAFAPFTNGEANWLDEWIPTAVEFLNAGAGVRRRRSSRSDTK